MIYAYKIQNECGDYVDGNGERWIVETARMVCGRIVHAWQQFANLEEALCYWGLVPYVEPEIEETEPEN